MIDNWQFTDVRFEEESPEQNRRVILLTADQYNALLYLWEDKTDILPTPCLVMASSYSKHEWLFIPDSSIKLSKEQNKQVLEMYGIQEFIDALWPTEISIHDVFTTTKLEGRNNVGSNKEL